MSSLIDAEHIQDMVRSFIEFERRQRLFLNRELEKFGIQNMMIKYIVSLHKRPGVSQDYLADVHSVDKSHVARMSGKLEEIGYVYRLQDESDRRLNCLYLTEKGEELYNELQILMMKWGTIITENISAEDIEHTVSTVKKLNCNIDIGCRQE